MDIRPSFAAQSYLQARDAAAPGAGSGEAGFARLAASFAQTLQEADSTAKAAMTGGADPHALVEALAATQNAVETVVTVRDRVVEAYQEILRMPV